jgi:methylmalonyl-CoA/ethylmalonyl-CoA epimerase
MKFLHTGYTVSDIDKTAAEFALFGYTKGKTLYDEKLQVEICNLTAPEGTVIELIRQLNPESLERKLLALNGVSPYHVCFETGDIYSDAEKLVSEGYEKLFEPVECQALGGKKICYFHKKETGYIELTEK